MYFFKLMRIEAKKLTAFYTRKLHREEQVLDEAKNPRVSIMCKSASATGVYNEDGVGRDKVTAAQVLSMYSHPAHQVLRVITISRRWDWRKTTAYQPE